MRNSETRRRVRGDFANFGCGNRSVNASQPFDNPRDSWWAHQDSNLGPTDYESAALTAELWARPSGLSCPAKSVARADAISNSDRAPQAMGVWHGADLFRLTVARYRRSLFLTTHECFARTSPEMKGRHTV